MIVAAAERKGEEHFHPLTHELISCVAEEELGLAGDVVPGAGSSTRSAYDRAVVRHIGRVDAMLRVC